MYDRKIGTELTRLTDLKHQEADFIFLLFVNQSWG